VVAGGLGVTNDAEIYPNVYKVLFNSDDAIATQYIGTFVPEGTPFTHTAGGNQVECVWSFVSTAVKCYVYGST